MIWMPMYIHIIFSYLAAVGFAVFLNAPKKTLYISGSIGMISWTIYIILMRINFDMMSANFIAASIAALLCEILARKMKKPTILFVVPGIITLIPGLGLYNTMYYVIEGNFQESFTTGANVLFASGSIALGVIVVSSLFRTYYKNLRKNEKVEIHKVSQISQQ
ncbi:MULTISPECIES: threonine/serine exporter family protein [Romboutsia]|uniref:threonine/serine exporter family protein n=1 Tax=Romboutsia TaxID=1501226 RepID=UPI0018995159|nr:MULTISPECIES: threonine/serine exporter family protein [Romboutsia]MCH1960322.1 threonine/serine exporter family protein [Romboutsia hominis]MCH1969244.1 threonine/serine exporter family protein [Romboutsia hominis]MDB8805122.1 threonine/serine exporter family protein [Romboutsia sp. 1001216sp1]MDB8808715.1 threonine/serine exporter family protein [Romboutsia sp. 1001216sp1]MDB8810767.1 threonine/serine exporter family protein [Romboutsia sp. 1001216sp1]